MFGFLRFDAGSWVLGVPGLGWVAIGILIGDSGWFWLDYWSWICGACSAACCLGFVFGSACFCMCAGVWYLVVWWFGLIWLCVSVWVC